MLPLPHELFYEILLHAMVRDVHELCTADYFRHIHRPTSFLNVPKVSREFRFIARKIILCAICGGTRVGYPHEPIRLDRLMAIFDYLRRISPTNYRHFQCYEEITFPTDSVVIATVCLNDMRGMIKMYWNISRRHMICFAALRLGMHQPARWLTLLQRLRELVQFAPSDLNWDRKPDNFMVLKYQVDYYNIHIAAFSYLSTLPGWTASQERRVAAFATYLQQLDRFASSFEKMRQLAPDLLYDLFSTTGLIGLLEESSRVPSLRSRATSIRRRWMPFIFNHQHRSSG